MASVFQRCKTDEKNQYYPCSKARCGHPWTVRYREPGGRAGGQREKSFPLKKDAEDFGVKMENDKRTGLYVDPKLGQTPLRVWGKEWLARQIIDESTWRNYNGFLENHLYPFMDPKTLAQLERIHFEQFIAHLIKGGMMASTINDRMRFVTGMIQDAVAKKYIPDNPAKGVKAPRVASAKVDEDEIPSLGEVDMMRETISPQYRLTIDLMAGAGLRISEALAFDPDCYRGDFIRIRWQVSSKAHVGSCKTRIKALKHRVEGEYRDIPIAPFLGDAIELHLNEWGTIPLGEDGKNIRAFFAPRERAKGTMPSANTYGYHFQKAQRKSGLVLPDGHWKYHPHSLRHFFASTALANGIPIHEVSAWLGHKSIKTTADIYGHLVPGAWDRCRSVMQEAMKPPAELSQAA
ncbi:tyrosine-type recombinase/integrase [Nocardia sp. IFM 10818]